jgi:hypothetical protein
MREALGRDVEPRDLAQLLADALAVIVRDTIDPDAGSFALDSETQREAERLAARYRDPSWTWRR